MITNLEYYKVFYYAAKAGSLTTAAKQLSKIDKVSSVKDEDLKWMEYRFGSVGAVALSSGMYN